MVVGYDISAYTAMKCFSGAAVTRKTAEVVSNILGVSVRDAFRFERDERPLSKKTIREYVLFANQVLHFAMSAITRCKPNSRCRRKEHAPDL